MTDARTILLVPARSAGRGVRRRARRAVARAASARWRRRSSPSSRCRSRSTSTACRGSSSPRSTASRRSPRGSSRPRFPPGASARRRRRRRAPPASRRSRRTATPPRSRGWWRTSGGPAPATSCTCAARMRPATSRRGCGRPESRPATSSSTTSRRGRCRRRRRALLAAGGADLLAFFSPRGARLFAAEARAAGWPLGAATAVSISPATDAGLDGLGLGAPARRAAPGPAGHARGDRPALSRRSSACYAKSLGLLSGAPPVARRGTRVDAETEIRRRGGRVR